MIDLLKARISGLDSFLGQTREILPSELVEPIRTTMVGLEKLAQDDKIDESALEESMSALLQGAVISGESTDDAYEKLIRRLNRAIQANDSIPGEYKWTVFTMPESVVISSEIRNQSGKWESRYYQADWTRDGDAFTFSDVREVEIKQIITIVQQAIGGLANAEHTPPDIELQETPVGAVIEQGGEKPPFLMQQVRAPIRLLDQGKAQKDGTVRFGGVATVGDVVNTQGQVYPAELWCQQVDLAQISLPMGRVIGASGHKADGQGFPRPPDPHEVSQKFTKLEMRGNQVAFEAVTTKTREGNDLAATLIAGIGFDMSTLVIATTKPGEFQGQKVDIVQADGFRLISIDVVLNGASPGSAVEYARLQANKHPEPRKETSMDPDEVTNKQNADVDGGGPDGTATPPQVLPQAAPVAAPAGLTDDDRAVLDQARGVTAQAQAIIDRDASRELVQKRNAAVSARIAQMVTDKELPEQFSDSARTMLQNMCATDEGIEAVMPALRQSIQPFLDSHARLASKGMYTPEYKDDGTSVDAPQSYEAAVEELIQSATERGILHEGNSSWVPGALPDFSDTRLCMRIMLQNFVKEKPELADAWLMMRNGMMKRVEDAEQFSRDRMSVLRQGARGQAIPTGATTTGDVAAAIPYVMPLMVDIFPQLIATQLGTLQPLKQSTGRVYHWKITDEDDADMSAVANFTGSYANDPGEKEEIKRLKGSLTSTNVTCLIKKLGYDLSVEVMRHLHSDFGIDGTGTMISACADQVAREWNYNILAEMVSGATAGNVNYGTLPPATGNYDGEQWQKQIITHIKKARNLIYKSRFADTVWIIGDPDSIDRIVWLAQAAGDYKGDGQGRVAEGIDIAGSLSTGERLVKVGWWDSLQTNTLLVGAKGKQWPQTGYVIAPYLGLFVTPIWIDPGTQDVEQSLQSEVAHQMLDGKYFATVTMQPGVAGSDP